MYTKFELPSCTHQYQSVGCHLAAGHHDRRSMKKILGVWLCKITIPIQS